MSHGPSSAAALTRADRRRLERALAATRLVREYRRLEAVLLVAEGLGVSEAARRVRAPRRSVQRWVAAYRRARDPAALADRPRSGRRRAAPELTREVVAAALAADPRALGYRATTWTVPLLASHLRAHSGCAISARTLRRRLREWRFRWKRPRYVYHRRAAHLPQKKGLSSAA
jgi:transposase